MLFILRLILELKNQVGIAKICVAIKYLSKSKYWWIEIMVLTEISAYKRIFQSVVRYENERAITALFLLICERGWSWCCWIKPFYKLESHPKS